MITPVVDARIKRVELTHQRGMQQLTSETTACLLVQTATAEAEDQHIDQQAERDAIIEPPASHYECF